MSETDWTRVPALLDGEGGMWLAIKRHREGPDECDGCGRMTAHGYTVLYVAPNGTVNNTGIWACRLDCARNSAEAS